MRDYYSLAAYFRNTTQPAKDGNVKDGRSSVIRIPSREDRPRWEALPGEIAAAKARRDERRREVQPEFEGWLAETSPESLEAQIPQVGLLAHLPLNEGVGNTVKSFAFAELTANAGELSSQTDANQATPAAANIDHVGPAVKATGELTWVPDGQLGPAPVMALGRSLELGGLGNFQWDESFSVGAWIRSPNKNINGGIIARMDEKDAYRGWDLYQGGGKIAVHIIQSWSDNALKVATKRDVITPNQWQHVLATYDGSGKPEGIKIYLNGQPEELQTEANTLKSDANVRTATPLRIGQRSDTQAFDGGAIQDMRLYGRALSAEEVSAIAGIGPLQALLTTPAAERTAEQQATLLEFYLTNYDAQFPTLVKALADLEAERNAIEQRSPVTHIQQEKMDSAPMANILMRGEYDQVGAEVPAAPPAALHALPSDAPNNRLGLAQWVVDPANPLTSRVVVNRFWQQLFGRGLVATTEDFGTTGTLPSHPELLDWLAIDFREGGWDVKRFFKQMLMSATYRQAAVTTPEKFELDRDNVLLSRGPRFRMDAEMVRDYALSASGLLSSKMFGPGVKPYQPDKIWDMVGLPGGDTRDYKPDSGEDLYRRTVYTFWKRMAPPPNLEAFNAPSREVCTVRRERTNTPLQALVTLNDPQFVEAARSLAEVSVTAALQDDSSIVDTIALRVLGRKFSERERQIVMASQQEIMAYYQAHPEDAQALLDVGDSKPQANLPSATLATWTMICNQIMNLDETLNK
ncbi:MAG: DUF1553 domain-containing protein [Pirellulaceae bacterium]